MTACRGSPLELPRPARGLQVYVRQAVRRPGGAAARRPGKRRGAGPGLVRGLCRRRGGAGRCRSRPRLERHPRRSRPQGPAPGPPGRGGPRRGGRRAPRAAGARAGTLSRHRRHSVLPQRPGADGGASRPAAGRAGLRPRWSQPGRAGSDPPVPRVAAERRAWEERRRPGRARYVGIERRRGADRRVTRRAPPLPHQRAACRDRAPARDARPECAQHGLGRGARRRARARPPGASGARREAGGCSASRCGVPSPDAPSKRSWTSRKQDAALRARAAEVLRWIGLDAAEVILDRLVQGEAIGVRGFYYDVVGGMPGAYPLVTPLLASHHPHEIRARRRAARPPGPAGGHRRAGAAHEPPGRERAGGGRAGHRRDPRGPGGRAASAGAASSRRPDPGGGGRGHRGRGAAGRWPCCWSTPLETERDRDAWLALRQRARPHRDGRDAAPRWAAWP